MSAPDLDGLDLHADARARATQSKESISARAMGTTRSQARDSAPDRRRRVSIRRLLILPYPALIVGVALLVGALSYRTGSDTADSLSDKLMLETVARIGQAVDRHIAGAGPALEAAFPDGVRAGARLDDEVDALRHRFWVATSLNRDPNNFVYYGNVDGQFLGVWRFSAKDAELRLKLRAEAPRVTYPFTGIDGALRQPVLEHEMFEARERPWFQVGRAAATDTWTPTYVDFRSGELVTTRVRRVLNAQGQFEGVVATDLSLRAINNFVHGLSLTRNAVAFIVEPDGNLIASSKSPNVSRDAAGNYVRLSAAASGDPLQVAGFAQLGGVVAHLKSGDKAETARFQAADGQTVQLAFQSMRNATGLNWIIAVAVPRNDFMAGTRHEVMSTAIIGLGTAILAALLGFWLVASSIRDLRRLAEVAREVGEGNWNVDVGVERADEIGDVASAFKALQRRLTTDPLTGLGNREGIVLAITDRIERESRAEHPRPFAVMFLDLNNFKLINDRFGHDIGDQVLIEVGERLRACTRADDLIARFAGDEFVVLINKASSAERIGEIRAQIEHALSQRYSCLPIGRSSAAPISGAAVGMALFPLHGRTVDGLLGCADLDMYARKNEAKLRG